MTSDARPAARERGLTAQRVVERSLLAHRDALAIVDGERRITYGDLRERTGRLATVLVALGAGAGRPAATFMPNRAEYVEVDVACMRAGVTRLGISDRLHAAEVEYIIDSSEAAVLITTPDALEQLAENLPPGLEAVLLVGDGEPGTFVGPRTLSYERALLDARPTVDFAPVGPGSPAFVMYTSGTTGRPKGATHTHGSRVAAALNMAASELRLDRSSVMVHAGPLTHGSGSKLLLVMATGAVNLVLPRFDPELMAAAVRDEGGSHTFLVPTTIQRLLDAGRGVHERIRSMAQISFGGSPISPAIFAAAIDQFGPILTQVYGSSEAPHPVTLLRPDDYLAPASEDDGVLLTAGTASLGTDLAVDDGGGAAPVRPGASGELLVRGRHLMAGYWRDEEASLSVLTADGWYRTGDLVTVDDASRVVFQDRKRDLIITGGLNVYPSEVERVISDHPGVAAVAVVGAPDPDWGEAVIAYVVASEPGSLTGNQVIEWARARLAGYKKPKRVVFLDELPLGSSNKVLRSRLRDPLWAGKDRRVQ